MRLRRIADLHVGHTARMQLKPSIILGYLVLLLPPLGVLAFHLYVASHAVEHMRRGILPEHFFFWRWFGLFACLFLLITISFLLLSFRYDQFSRVSTLFKLAAAQLLFIIIYGVDCMVLFSHILKD